MAQQYDAIVLGAGGMGSAAAYYLAKAGQKVLLLEQFELNHQKGSSYGHSRAIRYAYDHPIYINLMRAAYPLWFALEAEAGEQLYVKTGGLDLSFPDQLSFQDLRRSMDQAQLPYEHLTTSEVHQRFPQFCLDDGMEAFYQEDSGFLKASRCVLSHIRLAQARGATVIDATPVTKIIPNVNGVEIKTIADTYYADRLIITAGGWAKSLLAEQDIHLPLQIMPCQLGFYQSQNSVEFVPGQLPVFFFHMVGDYGEMPYGIPHAEEAIGIKLTTFQGWETVEHPDQVDYTPSLEWTEGMRRFAQQYLPRAAGPLLSTRRCLYTLTPDQHFVIDTHPNHKQIAIAAGFSGHGFKFSTLVGKMLTELALNGKTEYDTSLFKLSRFQEAVV
ncbi:MAG: N-methyl-L-tryptophan oxidase [Elainellaceae cyanobacterium]